MYHSLSLVCLYIFPIQVYVHMLWIQVHAILHYMLVTNAHTYTYNMYNIQSYTVYRYSRTMHYYSLLMLVAALLHTTTSTVYYVMPDNHYHPINDNTHTLQHYFNNTNKYFTSNTQLHFLPGQYYLNNDLMIQGVSNFTLVGNRIKINTVINCTSPAGIVVVGSSNIVIANMVMNECGNDYNSFTINIFANQGEDIESLLVFDSVFVTITYFYAQCQHKSCGFEFVNALECKLSNLISNYLLILYVGINGTLVNTTDTLFIENFQAYSEIDDIYTIEIEWNKIDFNFKATILNINFTNKLALHITCYQCFGNNSITIRNCNFNDMVNNHSSPMNTDYYRYPLYYYDDIYTCYYGFCDAKVGILLYPGQNSVSESKLYFIDCSFINNARSRKLLLINMENRYNTKTPTVTLKNCMFHSNKNTQLLLVRCHNDDSENYCASIFLKNITISSNIQSKDDIIYVYHVTLTFEDVKIMNNSFIGPTYIPKNYNIIIAEVSYLKYNSYNEISKNTARYSIVGVPIHISENSILNLSLNILDYYVEIFSFQNTDEIQTCAVQYISERGNLDKAFQSGQKLNFTIIHNNNNSKCVISDLYHCNWDLTSAFWTSSPLHVNQHFIPQKKFVKAPKTICLCKENSTADCYIEELGLFYPGVTVLFNFIIFSNSIDFALLQQNDDSHFTCRSKNSVKVNNGKCTSFNITLIHESGTWCELYLTASPIYPKDGIMQRVMYTIKLLPCPKGFSLHSEGYCQCDIILSSYIPSLTHCNIDDQTIPHPANSWISAHTVNNSHSYHVSLHCPFDYCLPHSSHLNLSTPDSQCQFNRSGLLCGQCQQGFSAVFGSSQCKQCSNVYLLIIIPIGMAGLGLVLLLFILNLTVTNGDVNAFLLYVNIISINSSIFFPISGPGKAIHTFISLANLDLGIITCFYGGMDDYAKMWLQLVFPAYLILIAMTFITASRYSTRVQRFTAHRALPVLATLFLLSFTKVLLAVSKVLFLYSPITYLPSHHTTLVWSVDATVPLLKIRFIILFIACIIIFIVLVPFNMLLIFARQLSRFKHINYFKPLLDAYQGPYKIRFYFWTGLQLLLRTFVLGLSGLDKNTNLMLSIIVFGILAWLIGRLSPFKNQLNNLLEALYMLNLLAVFTVALDVTESKRIAAIIINVLISLAIFKFACIIVVHVKNFCSAYIKGCNCNRMAKIFNSCFKKLTGTNHPPKSIELNNPVPGVAYIYNEFQEPLIGQD